MSKSEDASDLRKYNLTSNLQRLSWSFRRITYKNLWNN